VSVEWMRSKHRRINGLCAVCFEMHRGEDDPVSVPWPCDASVILSALDSEQRAHDPARLAPEGESC